MFSGHGKQDEAASPDTPQLDVGILVTTAAASTSRVIVMTSGGATIDVTPAAEQLLNLARGPAAGMPAAAHTHPCPTAWAALCQHLGQCRCQSCPAQMVDARALAGAAAAGHKTTVMIACNDPARVAAAIAALGAEPDIKAWIEDAAQPGRLIDALAARQPQVLLIDQPGFDGLDAQSIGAIRARAPDLQLVVMIDAATPDLLARIVRHRVRGLLQAQCPPAMIVKAIRAVSGGELWLPRAWLAQTMDERALAPTPDQAGAAFEGRSKLDEGGLTEREAQIVAQVRRGLTNKEIARRLGIQEDTVKKHLQSVFGKLGVRRRALVVLSQASPRRLGA